jgi:hypothetical protein
VVVIFVRDMDEARFMFEFEYESGLKKGTGREQGVDAPLQVIVQGLSCEVGGSRR